MRAGAELFHRAYQAQMRGELGEAERLYKDSIAAHPTAEAHTFLGWTYSLSERLDEAIAECQKAIEVDPEFGNPYNDIGAYLIQLGRFDEAIPWLEQATCATRYESPHFPRLNLGRAYLAKQMYSKALEEFQAALDLEPDDALARQAVDAIKRQLN
jgi:Tfp pilus assembly protein PilF